MTRSRGGFTIVELIVVAVVGSLMLAAALQILVTNQRTYTAQTATISGQQSTRMAVEVLFNELREVSPPGGDIVAMNAGSITVRLMRKYATVCAITYTPTPVLTVMHPAASAEPFEVFDSVFVFADNNQRDDDDDVWMEQQVTTPVPSATTCPQAGEPASLLTFTGQDSDFAANTVRVGAPVRSFATYTFTTTTLLDDTYLARQEGTGPVIPVAGPLRDNRGLQFVYRDALGAVTTTPADVRQIEVIVRTGSEVLNSLGDMVSDSVSVWIHTRN